MDAVTITINMKNKILNLIKKLFRRTDPPIPFKFYNVYAETVPGGFGYPEPIFNLLIEDMMDHIVDSDKLVSFAAFLQQPRITETYQLDSRSPRDMFILGYALASTFLMRDSIIKQRQLYSVVSQFVQPKQEKSGKPN